MRRKASKQPKLCNRTAANRQEQKYKDVFWELMRWLIISQQIFAEVRFHGNIKWHAEDVAVQALIWSWMETENVTDAFDESVEICQQLGLDGIAKTYATFLNALSRYQAIFISKTRELFQLKAKQAGGRFFRTDGWVLIGFDGSRATAPRSRSNEKAFCAKNYGHGTRAKYGKKKSKGLRRKRIQQNKPQPQEPQAWITMTWHMGMRLPWTWRLGPSNSSERHHVREMLGEEEFPENTLFCGDAGFVGYPLWSSIVDKGQDFLVRVGGNVSLLSEHTDVKKQGDGIVLCWPKGQMESGQPPLRLRLVHVKVGTTKMWMLTNVTNRSRLTKGKIVKIYKMRWGVEIEFRGLKQTLGKRKLRSRNCDRLLVELDWSIRGMAIAELFATSLQTSASAKQKESTHYDPSQRSLANTMRAFRKSLRNLEKPSTAEQGLLSMLEQALVERYNNTTDKRARYRPKNPDKQPLGEPTVEKMNAMQRKELARHGPIAA